MSNVKIYNLSHLIDAVGNGDDLIRMLAIFADSTPKILKELNNSYIDHDFDGIAACAHKLKATIDILKIEELKGIIREMDRLPLVEMNQQKLPQLISKTNEVMDKVLTEIKASYLTENRV